MQDAKYINYNNLKKDIIYVKQKMNVFLNNN